MFISNNRSALTLSGLLILLVQLSLSGQHPNQGIEESRQQSIASFNEGDFTSALPGFRSLVKREPGIAIHKYHLGICLVELNENLDEATALLYEASRKGAPNDVYYYLGVACHRNYNFSDAQKYFNRFESLASRQQIRELNIKRWINTCRSAREITASYNPYDVVNVTFLDLKDSVQYSQVRMKGGQLQRKPNQYFGKDEDMSALTGLMFMPENPVKGDFIYYSGYGRNSKNGAQLFRVRKGRGPVWGDPEEVTDLNSEGDEILPYYDPIESDLYYASDGRRGIGGFDLYRTHYDIDRDQWSEPVNMGFPVNSVMDEYLLLPGTDLGMVMFFSNRQGTDTTVTVFRVHLVEPKKKSAANDNRMLKEISNMGGVAVEILADIESISNNRELAALPAMGPPLPDNSVKEEFTEVTLVTPSVVKPEYQVTLAEALGHQSTSDSLKDLATATRIRIRESDDPNDRWIWQKQIMVWEKKARDEEALADKLYARMENEKYDQTGKPAVNIPESIEIDTVMDDLTVYQFTRPEMGIEGEPGSAPARNMANSNDINRFDILHHSPYSTANPIPMDVSLPGGAFYRIQLGAFGSEVDPGNFGGISPITGERNIERGLIKYYAGKFTRYDDASLALSRIRSGGYEDAFIAAWYNGNPVPTQKAKQLE